MLKTRSKQGNTSQGKPYTQRIKNYFLGSRGSNELPRSKASRTNASRSNASRSNASRSKRQESPVAHDPFIASNPIASNPIASNPIASNPIASNPVAPNPIAPNPIASNPINQFASTNQTAPKFNFELKPYNYDSRSGSANRISGSRKQSANRISGSRKKIRGKSFNSGVNSKKLNSKNLNIAANLVLSNILNETEFIQKLLNISDKLDKDSKIKRKLNILIILLEIYNNPIENSRHRISIEKLIPQNKQEEIIKKQENIIHNLLTQEPNVLETNVLIDQLIKYLLKIILTLKISEYKQFTMKDNLEIITTILQYIKDYEDFIKQIDPTYKYDNLCNSVNAIFKSMQSQDTYKSKDYTVFLNLVLETATYVIHDGANNRIEEVIEYLLFNIVKKRDKQTQKELKHLRNIIRDLKQQHTISDFIYDSIDNSLSKGIPFTIAVKKVYNYLRRKGVSEIILMPLFAPLYATSGISNALYQPVKYMTNWFKPVEQLKSENSQEKNLPIPIPIPIIPKSRSRSPKSGSPGSRSPKSRSPKTGSPKSGSPKSGSSTSYIEPYTSIIV